MRTIWTIFLCLFAACGSGEVSQRAAAASEGDNEAPQGSTCIAPRIRDQARLDPGYVRVNTLDPLFNIPVMVTARLLYHHGLEVTVADRRTPEEGRTIYDDYEADCKLDHGVAPGYKEGHWLELIPASNQPEYEAYLAALANGLSP